MNEILKLSILSFGSVVALFFISKLLGKKQIAQLEFIDYVIGISIGSVASDMATDIDGKPFYYYLISLSIFFLFDILITILGRKGPFLKRFLKGRPNIVIYEGKVDFKQLKKSKLDINDLLEFCRDKGYFNLNEIAYAIFESNGKLSIMPKSDYQEPKLKDLSIQTNESSLPNYLVVDGHISFSSLKNIGKDKEWLLKELQITNKELKKIIVASYDENTKKIDCQFK